MQRHGEIAERIVTEDEEEKEDPDPVPPVPIVILPPALVPPPGLVVERGRREYDVIKEAEEIANKVLEEPVQEPARLEYPERERADRVKRRLFPELEDGMREWTAEVVARTPEPQAFRRLEQYWNELETIRRGGRKLLDQLEVEERGVRHEGRGPDPEDYRAIAGNVEELVAELFTPGDVFDPIEQGWRTYGGYATEFPNLLWYSDKVGVPLVPLVSPEGVGGAGFNVNWGAILRYMLDPAANILGP